ncbi:MAG: hypothetical protein WC379_09365 [Methanoregula sp.]
MDNIGDLENHRYLRIAMRQLDAETYEEYQHRRYDGDNYQQDYSIYLRNSILIMRQPGQYS